VSYPAQERFDAATAAYREASRLNPALAHLAERSIALINHLQHVKARPRDAEALARLGEIYAGDGRSDRAIDCFERVVALAPDRPEGFVTLARQYEAEGRDAEALRAYGRGLELDPDNAQARNNRDKLAIKAALERGQPVALALGDGETVMIDPDRGASYYHLGLRHLRSDEAEAAVGALRQAAALEPGDDQVHLFLGLAYTSLGSYAEAEAALQRAIALRPANPQAYNYLGLVHHQQRRYRQALAAYRHAIDQAPRYAVAYVNLAASHEALGQTAEALAAYRQALRHDGNLAAVQEKIDALDRRSGR
jgi:tetratricopeptide (TPR) repeat protein